MGLRIDSIEIQGLSAEVARDLRGRLPAHEGAVLTEELAEATVRTVKDFDEHLRIGFEGAPSGGDQITILLPGSTLPVRLSAPLPAGRVQVAAGAQQVRLRSSVPPEYPALALQALIQGVVKLHALIGIDGTVQNLTVISGHPLLTAAAIQAAKQWIYAPLLVNGAAAEVDTEIDVTFTLPAK